MKNCSGSAARSASSRTTAADLPPSSRVTGRSNSAQAAATWRPALVEPVNDTWSTPGWETRYAPVSRPPGTMLITPSGMSVSSTA